MKRFCIAITAILIFFIIAPSHAVRLKDITDMKGVRKNQLVGYGLVVGLNGTGDGRNSKFTTYSLASMLEKMGMTVNPNDLKVNNVAAVMVTTELPPFSRTGSRIDVTVSSIGDAENLQGGTLLMTPLRAVNGLIYAVAQGAVSTGGFSAGGAGGNVQKNFPTVGRIVGGALIEKEVPAGFAPNGKITLALHHPDFTSASRIVRAINDALIGNFAVSPDAGTVWVNIPEAYRTDVVPFITLIESLDVTPDITARVVVNERTGTVVLGENVRIDTVGISHGNLNVRIEESAAVSQPPPFSEGETVAVPQTNINVTEEKAPIRLLESGVTIGDLVRALNAIGVTPRDLIAILQALKSAGALQAELEII